MPLITMTGMTTSSQHPHFGRDDTKVAVSECKFGIQFYLNLNHEDIFSLSQPCGKGVLFIGHKNWNMTVGVRIFQRSWSVF